MMMMMMDGETSGGGAAGAATDGAETKKEGQQQQQTEEERSQEQLGKKQEGPKADTASRDAGRSSATAGGDGGDGQDNEKPKRSQQKKKKKRMKGKVKRLIEPLTFYFSDANLRRDGFMRQQIEKDPDNYFPVKLFLKFNKVKTVTSRIQDVIHALEAIDAVELSADRQKVRRKNPEIKEKDVDACTIYVEKLPETFEHPDIHDLFSRFGSIEYISLPRWPNRKHKGFAFVEFATPQEASACRGHYAHQDARVLPMAASCWKGPPVDTRTLRSSLGVEPPPQSTAAPAPANQQEGAGEAVGEQQTTGQREADAVPGDPGEDIRVLLKSEWANLKREYKALQRRMVSSLKHAHREDPPQPYAAAEEPPHGAGRGTGEQRQQGGVGRTEEGQARGEPASTASHGAAGSERGGGHEGMEQQVGRKGQEEGEEGEEEAFDPNNVVRGVVLKLSDIPVGVTKQQLREHLLRRTNIGPQSIEYVDFMNGDTQGHVRMSDAESARRLRDSAVAPDDEDLWQPMSLDLLKGKPETEYWRRIHESKIQRRLKKKRRKAKRGKSKWLAAEAEVPRVAPTTRDRSLREAAKQRIHITFDDDDEEAEEVVEKGGGEAGAARAVAQIGRTQEAEEGGMFVDGEPQAKVPKRAREAEQQAPPQRTLSHEAAGPTKEEIEQALTGEEDVQVVADSATNRPPQQLHQPKQQHRRRRRSSLGAGGGEAGKRKPKKQEKKKKKGKKKSQADRDEGQAQQSTTTEGKPMDDEERQAESGGKRGEEEAGGNKRRKEQRKERRRSRHKKRGQGEEDGRDNGDDDDDGQPMGDEEALPRKRAKTIQ